MMKVPWQEMGEQRRNNYEGPMTMQRWERIIAWYEDESSECCENQTEPARHIETSNQ